MKRAKFGVNQVVIDIVLKRAVEILEREFRQGRWWYKCYKGTDGWIPEHCLRERDAKSTKKKVV